MQKEKIREFVKQEPRQLKQVVQKVKEEWGIISSKKTIQRILKTAVSGVDYFTIPKNLYVALPQLVLYGGSDCANPPWDF